MLLDAVGLPGRGVYLNGRTLWTWGSIYEPGRVYKASPSELTYRDCGKLCTYNPTCVAWSHGTGRTATLNGYPGSFGSGCKLFTSKDDYNSDENEYLGSTTTPFWISGERGCFGKKM